MNGIVWELRTGTEDFRRWPVLSGSNWFDCRQRKTRLRSEEKLIKCECRSEKMTSQTDANNAYEISSCLSVNWLLHTIRKAGGSNKIANENSKKHWYDIVLIIVLPDLMFFLSHHAILPNMPMWANSAYLTLPLYERRPGLFCCCMNRKYIRNVSRKAENYFLWASVCKQGLLIVSQRTFQCIHIE